VVYNENLPPFIGPDETPGAEYTILFIVIAIEVWF